MLGMVPYSFTVTSHIIVTFALAAFIFLGVTADRLLEARRKFLKFFVPEGVPFVMLPLLVVIEVISYLTRPDLALGAAVRQHDGGHTMLKVFGAFRRALGFLGGWAALAFMVAFTGLEILVAYLAGLRVRHPDLHLSQRRPAHASTLANRTSIVPKERTSWIHQQQN
jgi:F-type H+-transporting ATPase subunit a